MRKLGSFVVFVEEFLTDCNYDRVVVSNMCLFSLLGVLGELFFLRIVPYAPCMGRFTYICHKCSRVNVFFIFRDMEHLGFYGLYHDWVVVSMHLLLHLFIFTPTRGNHPILLTCENGLKPPTS